MKNFTTEKDADGIVLITWDSPGKSMNVIDQSVMEELNELIDTVSSDESIKGAVITSGKKAFGAGADLTMLQGMLGEYATMKAQDEDKAARMLVDGASSMNTTLRKLETGGKPWVAALNGTALGGCLEIALACHARVSADNDAITFGLPEIKVGLLPGGGGTQRIPRLVNPQDAVSMLLQGKNQRPKKAKQLGFINEVVPADDVIETSKQLIRDGLKPVAPWDVKGFKAPISIWSPQGVQMISAGNAIMHRETYGNYPAATNIMKCVYEGLQVPFDLAIKIETRYFANVMTTPEARAMIRSLFINMQELNKGARRPDVPANTIKKVGVLGAGLMGAGIAYVTAKAGMEVVLIDRDQEYAEKGKAYSANILDKAISRKHSTPEKKDALLSLITPSTDYALLDDCDLVVEAVFEEKGVKKDVTEKAEAVMAKSAIFASNTSTIPITDLAKASSRAENFIGIHFFSPVDKMLLVEIIMGKKSGDAALAMAIDYVLAIKKTPIVVNDSRGFYVNRCVGRYMSEAWSMLIEGVPAPMIDTVAKMAGMPIGPLQLNDEVAIDLSQKVLKQTAADLGDGAVDPAQVDLINTMIDKHGRLGKKAGKGFYDYPAKPAKKHLWPELKELYPQQNADDVSVQDIKDRYLYTIAMEAARTVQEGVVTDIREADVGAILGFGFAPFTGGPLTFIDEIGLVNFQKRARQLAKKYGDHFKPIKLINQMAKNGETFYEKFAVQAKDKKAA